MLLTSVYPCTPGQVDEQAGEEEMNVLSKPGEVTFHCFLLTTSNSFFLHPTIASRVAILPVSSNEANSKHNELLKSPWIIADRCKCGGSSCKDKLL